MLRIRKRLTSRSFSSPAMATCVFVLLQATANAELVQWRVEDGGNGHWYEAVYVEGKIDWTDARDAAVDLGGYLATCTSAAENDFVFQVACSDSRVWVNDYDGSGRPVSFGPWLGGYQPPGSPEPGGNWQWVTGEPFGYCNWDSRYLNNSTGQDATQFLGRAHNNPDRTWNDMNHDRPFAGYMVEYAVPEPSGLALLFAAIITGCLFWRRRALRVRSIAVAGTMLLAGSVISVADAELVQWPGNGHWYETVYVNGGITWADARDAAAAAGGHLATIGSQAENDFVFSLAVADPRLWYNTSDTGGPWLGGYQPLGAQEPGGGWAWITGESFSYSKWGSSLNDSSGDQDYLQFWGDGKDHPQSKWNDMWNDPPSQGGPPVPGYVCEFEVPEPPALAILAIAAVCYLPMLRRRAVQRNS